MNIHTIALYILVTLTGMVVATFAAYYILNEFVYPGKLQQLDTRGASSDIEALP